MASPSFDPEKLYEALDRKRRRQHIKWRDVAAGAGVSPSTLTRISQGKRPDADSLVRLMAWLGQFDIRQFTTPCGKTLDPQGDSLHWCCQGCQYRWMEQGLVPLPAPSPIFPTVPAPRTVARPVVVPPTPTPAVLEVPAEAPRRVGGAAPSEPASSLAPAAVSPSRFAARWPRIGRLRMGRK